MSYERKRRCGSVEFEHVVSSKARLIDDIKDTTGAGDAFDWFLYAQLLNKNFEQTITIAQKKLAVLNFKTLADCSAVLIFKNII
jgi:sugar/nucleoside kinase (ribokinase family)